MATDAERKPEHRCGECARFRVPDAGCPNHYNFTEYVDGRPLMDAESAACSDFHQARKTKDKKTKKQFKDSGITVDGSFEAIYHKAKPCFLVKNSETFSIVECLEIDGQVFYPKEARQFPYEPYGYSEAQVPGWETLFWMVRREFQIFVDTDSIWLDVLASCAMLTYQQEKLTTVPYILAYGDTEAGKTTILNVLNALSYRPLFGITIPSADIYGYLEDSDSIGCILEDEIQGIHKDNDKLKIYKSGYKAGATVPRTIITNFDRSIRYYRTFSFKACASEQLPTVKGFRERFIEIPMVEGSPEREWTDLTKEDRERFRELRNTLLKWRMLSRDLDLSDVQLNMKGRLKELWKPILRIVSGLTVYAGLSSFVENQRKERLSVKQETLEGKIVKVVIEQVNAEKDDSCEIPFHDIWNMLREELDGKLDDKKPHAMETSEFFTVTKNKVGYRLREILSGRTKVLRQKDNDGNWVSLKAYEFDPAKLRKIAKKYGYEFVTKLPTLPSSESAQPSESMVEDTSDNVEKQPHAPLQLGKLSNMVTAEEPNSGAGLIPCMYCKAQGKHTLFASDRDLRAHVEHWHESASYAR